MRFFTTYCWGEFSSIENIQSLLRAGADKFINSAAIIEPEIIKKSSEYFGNQCIVVAVDAKKFKMTGMFSHGNQNTGIYALEWIEKVQKFGAGEFLLTSMDKDGTKSGFDTDLLCKVSQLLQIPLIASGGLAS